MDNENWLRRDLGKVLKELIFKLLASGCSTAVESVPPDSEIVGSNPTDRSAVYLLVLSLYLSGMTSDEDPLRICSTILIFPYKLLSWAS